MRAAAARDERDLLALRDVLQRIGLADSTHSVESYLSKKTSLSAFVPPLLVREPLTGTLRPRHFALLLFGRNPQLFIPGAVSFFATYDGTDRAAHRGQRLELAQTLIEQLRIMLPAVEAEAKTLFDKLDSAHPTVLTYPARALREALVSAFAHRDYELLDPLRVTAFADRIEFSSPGALPLGIVPAELNAGTAGPRWRNQTLAWFFTRLGYAEFAFPCFFAMEPKE